MLAARVCHADAGTNNDADREISECPDNSDWEAVWTYVPDPPLLAYIPDCLASRF